VYTRYERGGGGGGGGASLPSPVNNTPPVCAGDFADFLLSSDFFKKRACFARFLCNLSHIFRFPF